MKKLKIKKALLAICLALPITLKMSNEINASQKYNHPVLGNKGQLQNNTPNGNIHPQNNPPTNGPIQPNDEAPPQARQKTTLTGTLQQYLIARQSSKSLPTDAEIKELLLRHIKDNKYKYLASMILTNFGLIPLHTPNTHYQVLTTGWLFEPLFNNTPATPTLYENTSNSDNIQQIYKLLKHLHALRIASSDPSTPATDILKILFTSDPVEFSEGQTNYTILDQLLKNYSEGKFQHKDEQHEELINTFEQVAKQLNLESADIGDEYKRQKISQLEKIVRDFSKAYKRKHNKTKQIQTNTTKHRTTKTTNEKRDDFDIKAIEKLIQEWKQQSDQINKEKEEKLQKLEQAINSLERKYNKIVKGKKVKRQPT